MATMKRSAMFPMAKTTGVLAALGTTTMAMPLCVKRPVYCQEQGISRERLSGISLTQQLLVKVPRPVVLEENNPIIHKGEISFGAVLGLCTGYFIKKVGKLFALMIGLGFVFLQVSMSQ